MSQHRTIAPRTRRQLEISIRGAVPGLLSVDVLRLIEAIDTGFTVKRRYLIEDSTSVTPEPGQVWRSVRSGRLARIDRLHAGDVHWSNIDGTEGPKSGEIWVADFLEKYEYVPERRAGK